jgi:uncharacterized protein (DUF2062 family)
VLVVTLLILILASEALAVVANAISGSAVVAAVGTLLANALTAPLLAIASAVLYLELLQLKGEQLPPADMSSFTGEG